MIKYHIVKAIDPPHPPVWAIMDESEEWVFDTYDTAEEAERVLAKWIAADEADAQQEAEWLYQDDGRRE